MTDLYSPVVDPLTGRRLITGLFSFGEDSFGGLYLVDLNGGAIYAMVPAPSTWALMLGALGPLLWLAGSRR